MIGKIISHFKILEKLGTGGMGVVYKAEDTRLKRMVALKFLPPDLTRDAEAKERFIHEAQAASALEHPNICNIHEINETGDGQLYIVMAFYEGETLKEAVGSGPLPVGRMIETAVHIAEGLKEAHDKGIVHRDIKPANIMISHRGEVKIMDFGLAKLVSQTQLTKTGSTLGTAPYMSPEQTRGEKVDARTDIWSLGVLLYEMLTGQLPFKGTYEQAVIYSILNEEPEPPTSLRSNVPMELERIVKKALQKDRNSRYQRMEDFLVDLRAIGRDINIRRATANLPKVKSHWMKRVMIYAGIILIFVLLSIVGMTVLGPNNEPANSIAVLPLENLSQDPEQEYFSDGMTEALITELSKIQALRVISRTSVMHYKKTGKTIPEIARELKVYAIIEGSVLRVKERVRITAQLIRANPEQHLWAESYDRDLQDILALHSEVARAISDEIKVKLSQQDRVRLARTKRINPEAYELFLKGKYYWNKFTVEGLNKGIDYFSRAIEKDPNYASAYAGLSDCYSVLGGSYLRPRENFPKAESYAAKALALDATLADAHASLGACNLNFDWDFAAAEQEIKLAMDLKPNYANAYDLYASYLQAMKRPDESIGWIKRALEVDPVAILFNSNLAWAYYYTRDYDKAIEQARKTLELDPNFGYASLIFAWASGQKAMYSEAIIELNRARALSGEWPAQIAELGYVYAVSGQDAQARQLIQELKKRAKQDYVDPYFIAIIYLGLGEKDQMMVWLEKALQERSAWIPMLMVEPRFDQLRSDPQFKLLLTKIKREE